MKIRWTALILGVAVLVAAIIGGVKRQTYTDVASNENPIEAFHVAAFQEGWGSIMDMITSDEFMELVRDETNYIVKVKAVSDLQFEFLCTTQVFEVEEVFEGEGLSAGEVITIPLGPLYFDDWSVNMNFKNKNEVGKEYLVYLEKELSVPECENRVFTIPGMVIEPFFPYEEGTSTPTLDRGLAGIYVEYNEVKDDLYFVQTQEGLDALLTYREHLMEGYR